MIKRDGVFEKISWDEVYDYIANKLTNYKEEFGADVIAGISSSSYTNEEYYLMQKFIRAVVGTNNIDGCARSIAFANSPRHAKNFWNRSGYQFYL
ncbi:MAG: formate dehydrogenase major subunit [Halioglobus sp.]|jgi:formate dehydrogenase major subunit